MIAYDIANRRRLQKLHRYLSQRSQMLQNSVYYFQGSEAEFASCLEQLGRCIEPEIDDVRIYVLAPQEQLIRYGRRLLPEGIVFATI